MDLDDLTLTSIDSQRHLTTSEDIVKAVAFAVRAGHNDVTAYRFITALVMTDRLMRPNWQATLRRVLNLQDAAQREEQEN